MAKEKIRCQHCNRLILYEAKEIKSQEIACRFCRKQTPAEAKAVARFVRTAPRKLRLVANLIRGKTVQEAVILLRFLPKRAARVLLKVVESAKANAADAYQMNPENLRISQVTIDGGPTLKRFMPRAMGRAASIHKRMSHVVVKVKESQFSAVGKKESAGKVKSKKIAGKG